MKIASIDIGTNTINLLIADIDKNKLSPIFNSVIGAKLGKGGMNRGILTKEAMNRGYDAIKQHLTTIKPFKVNCIYIFATSAVRNAKNQMEFISGVKNRFDLDIEIIPGSEEARLIYQGVKQAVSLSEEPSLILDIGGGSNEFIIANNSGILWKQSFELGIARLIEKFSPTDPIKEAEIVNIINYLREQLEPLFIALKQFSPEQLIGASGAFDTIAKMTTFRISQSELKESDAGMEIPLKIIMELHKEMIHSTLEKRKKMPGMDPVRVEFMAVGMIFIGFIIQHAGIKSVWQSSWAIKEGIIFDMLEKTKITHL